MLPSGDKVNYFQGHVFRNLNKVEVCGEGNCTINSEGGNRGMKQGCNNNKVKERHLGMDFDKN